MVVLLPVDIYRCGQSECVLVSEPRPLLPQNDVLVLRWAPNCGNTDQPNALSLCSVRGCYLGDCACFLDLPCRGVRGLSYEVLWAFGR